MPALDLSQLAMQFAVTNRTVGRAQAGGEPRRETPIARIACVGCKAVNISKD
jgi:hypothetical protein